MAKIILTHEVSGLGSAGDVVDVKPGYARNYLIPQGFAVSWTRGGEKEVAAIRAARAARALATAEEAQALKERLEAVTIRLEAKAGASGRLFGSVKPADVAQAVEAAGIGSVDKRKIEVGSSIRSTGTYQASVRVYDDVVAQLTLEVVAQKA
ncbi:MAG TPA: 50S ribosomal protein L9 [Pseudoclavibacter sp.]|nr:50S ribosomal protein L9 [Pseudoclavibacter sp.]